mmetsp:Transcript_39536/g.82116  ORF Transcript_39536/g.82116 Transcript_39536/m.82116 type:complete len:331 (+) Transcript_39536:1631-2623(+)
MVVILTQFFGIIFLQQLQEFLLTDSSTAILVQFIDDRSNLINRETHAQRINLTLQFSNSEFSTMVIVEHFKQVFGSLVQRHGISSRVGLVPIEELLLRHFTITVSIKCADHPHESIVRQIRSETRQKIAELLMGNCSTVIRVQGIKRFRHLLLFECRERIPTTFRRQRVVHGGCCHGRFRIPRKSIVGRVPHFVNNEECSNHSSGLGFQEHIADDLRFTIRANRNHLREGSHETFLIVGNSNNRQGSKHHEQNSKWPKVNFKDERHKCQEMQTSVNTDKHKIGLQENEIQTGAKRIHEKQRLLSVWLSSYKTFGEYVSFPPIFVKINIAP